MTTVLIADDQELVRTGLRTVLERQEGIAVLGEAADGQEAVAATEALDPDVVLMDVQMPVMDGITATAAIRRMERYRSLPIIAVTANVMPQDRQRCLAAGMNDFLAKPVEPDHLCDLLRKWIRPRPQSRFVGGRAQDASATAHG